MFFNKSKEGKGEERLETTLRGLHMNASRSSLNASEKDRMKAHLMNVIRKGAEKEFLPSGLHRLARRVRLMGGQVHIPQWSLHMLKERVLDYADSTQRLRTLNVFGHASMLRSVASAFVLVLFVLTAVLMLPVQIPLTYAREAIFDRISGEVFVLREGILIRAEQSMILQEGDAIVTHDSSSATIRFLNDSVSRLGENTQLELRRLTRMPFEQAAINIEMFVHEGRVWNKVVHRSADATRFTVDTSRLAAVAQKKASFDVHETSDSTELAVFDNIVQVTTVKARVEIPKTLVAGYTAQVNDTDGNAIAIDVLPRHEISRKESSPWVAVNLTDDKEYDKALLQEKEVLIGTSEGGPVHDGSEPLADPKAENLRRDFLDAYKGFVRAQTDFMRGTTIEAQDELNNFQAKVGDILVLMNGMDDVQRQEVLSVMRGRIDSQLGDYDNFHPGHKLYAAKEALQDIQVKLTPDNLERARVALNQAESMLMEIEQLSGENKLGFAATLLKKYQSRTNDVMSSLRVDSPLEKQEHVGKLISQQADQIKLLTAVEQSLVYGDQQAFRDQVRDVRQETLRKFVLALDQVPYGVPQTTLYEIKDLYDMYGQKGSAEEEMIQPALNKYLAQNYQLSFIDPAGVTPEDVEILPLSAALQATADVQDAAVLDLSGDESDDGTSSKPSALQEEIMKIPTLDLSGDQNDGDKDKSPEPESATSEPSEVQE